jgi:hypothetical protein
VVYNADGETSTPLWQFKGVTTAPYNTGFEGRGLVKAHFQLVHPGAETPEMTQARIMSSFQTGLAAVAATVISVMSLAVPIVAPFVAAASALLLFASYRRHKSTVLYVALMVTVLVFVASLIIDFGLLAVRTGPVSVTVSP